MLRNRCPHLSQGAFDGVVQRRPLKRLQEASAEIESNQLGHGERDRGCRAEALREPPADSAVSQVRFNRESCLLQRSNIPLHSALCNTKLCVQLGQGAAITSG